LIAWDVLNPDSYCSLVMLPLYFQKCWTNMNVKARTVQCSALETIGRWNKSDEAEVLHDR